MISERDLIWMAGIIEVKGIVVQKNNQLRVTPQVVLSVDSQNSRLIYRLCDLTGVSADVKQRNFTANLTRRGCVEHCPDSHIHIREVTMPPVYKWAITGVAIVIVISSLKPYFMDDDETSTMSLLLRQGRDGLTLSGRGSGAVRSSAARLARKGWELPEEVREAILNEFTGSISDGIRAG